MDNVVLLDTDFVLDNFLVEDLENTANSSGILFGHIKDLFYFIVKDNSTGGEFKGMGHTDKTFLKGIAIQTIKISLGQTKEWERRTELISLIEDLEKW